MKYVLFCILALAFLNVVNANANYQMKQDSQKLVKMGYTL
jgi:hypothetical protein